MASLNKVILIGNLGKDPELRYTQAQMPFAKFSLATTESFTTQAGEKRDKTEWHNITIWGKQAEIAQKYLTKGRQVYIEGSIEYREYEDQNGQKRHTTDIKCTRFLMLGRAEQGGGGGGNFGGGGGGGNFGGGGGGGGNYGGGGGGNFGGGRGGNDAAPMNYGAPMGGNVPENDDFNDDDIPF